MRASDPEKLALQEIDRRAALYQKIKRHDLFEAELLLSERDVVHFVNTWGSTFDPRVDPKHFPFKLYNYQAETLRWLDERYLKKETGMIEKSRDMGATWLIVAWAAHKWLFGSGFVCRFGSRKEDLVDDGTMDSIFGKLRYYLAKLPGFLKPKIRPKFEDCHLKLVHPINGNEIVGESANTGFGRGGRSSIAFLDEFAFIEKSEAVWASVYHNSNCLIPVSTPNGKGNQFSWLKFDAKIKCLSLHWKNHPHKDDEWYEKQKADLMDWQVAQELDLSYERSKQGRIYQRFTHEKHVSKENITYNPDYEQWVTWDFGFGGAMAIIFIQISPEGMIQVWAYFEVTGQDIDFCIPVSKGFAPKELPLCTDKDARLIKWVLTKVSMGHDARHCGDNAGKAQTANSKRSCKDALKTAKIEFISTGKQTYDWRIKCLDNLLKLRHNDRTDQWVSRFQISPDCQRVIDCINNYEWEGKPEDGGDLKPKINWASHIATALEFFAINRFPLSTTAGVSEERHR